MPAGVTISVSVISVSRCGCLRVTNTPTNRNIRLLVVHFVFALLAQNSVDVVPIEKKNPSVKQKYISLHSLPTIFRFPFPSYYYFRMLDIHTDSSIHPSKSIRPSTRPPIHWSMHPFIHACIHSFVHSFIHSFIDACTRPSTRSFIRAFIH